MTRTRAPSPVGAHGSTGVGARYCLSDAVEAGAIDADRAHRGGPLFSGCVRDERTWRCGVVGPGEWEGVEGGSRPGRAAVRRSSGEPPDVDAGRIERPPHIRDHELLPATVQHPHNDPPAWP